MINSLERKLLLLYIQWKLKKLTKRSVTMKVVGKCTIILPSVELIFPNNTDGNPTSVKVGRTTISDFMHSDMDSTEIKTSVEAYSEVYTKALPTALNALVDVFCNAVPKFILANNQMQENRRTNNIANAENFMEEHRILNPDSVPFGGDLDEKV